MGDVADHRLVDGRMGLEHALTAGLILPCDPVRNAAIAELLKISA